MKEITKKIAMLSLITTIMLPLTSCINSDGEFEMNFFSWILVIFIFFMIVGFIKMKSDEKEAKEKGLTMEEFSEQKRRENEAIEKAREEENRKREMEFGITVKYLGGYPKWAKPCDVKFSISDSKIVLDDYGDKFIIPKEDIVAISNEKSSSRSVGKTAAGAVVGGVLTGGIGLLVGGALGARKKDTSEIYITYKYNAVELTLHLQPGKNVDKVYTWINTVYA